MTELDLRALVRDAVRRHLGAAEGAAAPETSLRSEMSPHVAHALHVTLVNSTDDCLIEPAVRCHHCGYCKTHGY